MVGTILTADATALVLALIAVVTGAIVVALGLAATATESPLWCIGAVLWGVLLALAPHAAPRTAPAPAEAGVAASARNAERPPEGGRS